MSSPYSHYFQTGARNFFLRGGSAVFEASQMRTSLRRRDYVNTFPACKLAPDGGAAFCAPSLFPRSHCQYGPIGPPPPGPAAQQGLCILPRPAPPSSPSRAGQVPTPQVYRLPRPQPRPPPAASAPNETGARNRSHARTAARRPPRAGRHARRSAAKTAIALRPAASECPPCLAAGAVQVSHAATRLDHAARDARAPAAAPPYSAPPWGGARRRRRHRHCHRRWQLSSPSRVPPRASVF
jgi:hypothetical protein